MEIEKELIDKLLAEYKKPEDILGENGLLKQLTKALVERALQAEMTTHLGYEKHDPEGHNCRGTDKRASIRSWCLRGRRVFRASLPTFSTSLRMTGFGPSGFPFPLRLLSGATESRFLSGMAERKTNTSSYSADVGHPPRTFHQRWLQKFFLATRSSAGE